MKLCANYFLSATSRTEEFNLSRDKENNCSTRGRKVRKQMVCESVWSLFHADQAQYNKKHLLVRL